MFASKEKQRHFFLLFSNIFGFKGGIQVYSIFFLQALQELYPNAAYDVFLKYDRKTNSHHQFSSQTRFHCLGKWHRFVQSLLLALKTIILGIWRRPTLVVTTHLNYSIACYWLKRLTGVPYWVVVHGLEGWNLTRPMPRAALRYADKVVAVSHYTRDRLLDEQQLNPAKVSVLPNTFVAHQFQPTPKPSYLLSRYELSPQQPVILTVTRLGRSASYKGYDQILQALVKIRHHIPNVRYILAGKGDDRPRIESLVKRLNLQENVTFAGFVPDEELAAHYNLCDTFAMPSRGEGFGIVYLEALACGKPVLAGNRDGAVDPLLGGKLGCLVDPDDVDAIANNLMQILQGSHPNSLLFDPQGLRQQTIEKFEFTQFRKILVRLMADGTPVSCLCL